MSTIAEIEVPAPEFALWHTLERHPELDFEIERVVAHDDSHVMPFIWIESPETGLDALEAALEADPSVEKVRVLDDFTDRFLLQMHWIADIPLVHAILDSGGTVLSAHGTSDRWVFRVLFPDRSVLSAAHDRGMEEGFTMEIRNIYQMEDNRHARFGLTEDQHETLIEAFDRGYFDVPREVTLNEFAEELGISHQALSERLRRAHYNLIKNGLVIGPDVTDEIQ